MKLKEYLDMMGIKYTAFTERAGISRNTLYNLMAGKRRPSLELAVEIEKLTDGKVSPRDWIDENVEPKRRAAKRKNTIEELKKNPPKKRKNSAKE